jgi:hypothetical protein
LGSGARLLPLHKVGNLGRRHTGCFRDTALPIAFKYEFWGVAFLLRHGVDYGTFSS